MTGTIKKTVPRRAGPAGRVREQLAKIYDRHAPAVYRQALLMLGDEDLAGQVTGEVIVAECALPGASPRDADRVSGRLAASTLRRCRELMDAQAREGRASQGRHARGRSGAPGPDDSERALLGLVLFGGLGYREAARELAISPSRAAQSLRSALIALASTPPDLLPGE